MRVAVMCIGNELLMDEGVGPACARYLQSRYAFPDNVDVIDRACMGMAIISDLRAYDYVLVVDALAVPDARPGQIFSFAPEDVAPTPAGMTSLHEVRFADVLGSAKLLGVDCAGHCLGVQVENMSPSEFIIALTPRVAAALPLLAQAAVRHLRSELGLAVEDVLAAQDPLRAGCPVVGARDFSRDGVCADGTAAEQAVLAGAPHAVLPEVYGQQDISVMARYLADGLRAVGVADALGAVSAMDAVGGLGDESGDDAKRRVGLALPATDAMQADRARGVAARFGLEEGADGRAGVLRYAAWVSRATTDYDCDALIGACLEAVEAAG